MELKDLRYKSSNSGRPKSNLTDKDWQNEFAILKINIKPVDKKITKLNSKMRETYSEDKIYDGMTNWGSYCSYINDILKNIKKGHVDYCYYKYQIADLLKFHHDDLRTRFCDGYWEVWLDNEK